MRFSFCIFVQNYKIGGVNTNGKRRESHNKKFKRYQK